MEMNEVLENRIERKAENCLKKYPEQVKSLEKDSPLSKCRPITPMDLYALGEMLDSWDLVEQIAEADGSIGDLGVLPKIAHDVITVSYGSSPLSIVSTVQPIEEELGTIYYKDVKVLDTAGAMTAGDTIFSAESGAPNPLEGYASATLTVSIGTGDGSVTNFENSGSPFSGLPVKANSVSVTAGAISGSDDGSGNIVGAGIADGGSIDYATGVIDITFTVAPAAGVDISVEYHVNVEAKSDINELNWELQPKAIRAKVYTLKGTVGMLKSFALRKRFGTVAEDEIALDLTNAINSEVFGDMIRKMVANVQGNTDYDKQVSGLSQFEQKQVFKDFFFGDTEAVLVGNAGRGTVSWAVCGLNVCSLINSQAGFTKLYDGSSVFGAHLYGTLDGMPIIRVPNNGLLNANQAIMGFKGLSAFDAALAYAPYMPLTVTSMLPTANPLVNQRAAAVWAGVEVLIKNFLTKFTVI